MKNEYSIISCGRVYHPAEWFYNPAYVVNRIYYICMGTAYYMDNVPLKPGCLYIFRANPGFRVRQEEADPVDHVFFDFLTYKKLINRDYIEIDPKQDPRLFHILEVIKEDYTKTPIEEISNSYLKLLIYYLNSYLIPDTCYSDTTSAVLEIMHTHPVQELSVHYIAEQVNKNVNHIIRCFKGELGMTPHKYLSMMKVDIAISSLRKGMNCTEVTELLGFGSLSALSYFFKKETGKNLSEYIPHEKKG